MAYKKDVLRQFGLDREEYKDGISFYPLNNKTDMDPRIFFDLITYNVSELFRKITIRTLNHDEPKIMVDFVNDQMTQRIKMKPKFYATFGRCYSLQMPDDIISNGIISIELIAKIDIYVYFGHPGQFMNVDTKSKVI